MHVRLTSIHHENSCTLSTHWGRERMAAISQTTFSNAFSWIKICEFRLKLPIKKFVPYGPINNIPALVQIMAWCRPGDKPLSEPMMVKLPTYICVTRPQWVKSMELVSCDFMDHNYGNDLICTTINEHNRKYDIISAFGPCAKNTLILAFTLWRTRRRCPSTTHGELSK